jgi:hypothetical protein
LTVTELNPWDSFLKSPTVARKIANYKLIRGKLNVKFVINGSPFLYGKLLAAYHPLYSVDDFAPKNKADHICRLSQRQHVYLNPTTSSGGELTLPFFWPYNAVHIPLAEWTNLGIVTLFPISTLKHAAGEVPNCTITIFAWMSGAELMQPTASIGNYVGQMGESSKKVVSKTATAVGSIAGTLANAPVIGPYARATEEVATKLGRIADLFGFSKPRGTHDFMDARQRNIGTLATTNDKDTCRTLTLDVKNETTIDPRTVGLEGTDEMSIPFLCSREALITRFSWDVSDAPDKELLRIPVTPYIRSTFNTDGTTDLPHCAYIASFFKYWRGSMEYRIMVNASNFHRGKLRIRYEPYGSTVDNGQDYNVVQSEILDLSEMHDHKVSVGWGSDRNYLKVTSAFFTPRRPGDGVDLKSHNGTLIISVANNLTVPDETSETSVEILVGVNAGQDIEFAVPDDTAMKNTKITADVTPLTIPTPTDPQDPQTPGGTNTFPQPSINSTTNRAGVFYYGWHTDNFHGNQGYLRDKLANPQYPTVPGLPDGEYDDNDRSVVRAQFDVMLNAGIDFCICSWWGPTTITNTQFKDYAFLEAGAVAAGTMNVALLYEMGKLRVDGQRIVTNAVLQEIQSDMAYAKLNYFSSSKYLKRNLKDGTQTNCPVIFLYLLRGYSDSDKVLILQQIINTCQDSNIAGYSTYPYIIGDLMFGTPRSFGGSVTSRLGALGAYDVGGQIKQGNNPIGDNDVGYLHSQFSDWALFNPAVDMMPTISPGYNDKGVRAGNDILPRALAGYDEGSLFKSMLKNLDISFGNKTNQMFCINSWNEWHEDSQIEPCGGGAATNLPTDLTAGITYEPYDTKYVNIVGNFMDSGYVAQSGEERENEHAPEGSVEETLLNPQTTYHNDDAIFFGERIASLRTMIKRYTRYATFDTTDNVKSSMRMPHFPYYNWDNPSDDLQETLLTRIGVLFLARRGSTRWKAIPDFRDDRPKTHAVRLVDQGYHEIVDNVSVDDWIDTGWNGADVATNQYNPVLEWESPYYSNKRFEISRKLKRLDERGHIHSYDGDNVLRNTYMVAAGDDLQFFYALDVPSLTYT